MANRIMRQIPSIPATTKVSLMQTDTEFAKLRTSVNGRNIVAMGIAGATVNTGKLTAFVANEQVIEVPNGVTNTAGAPVRQDDVISVNEPIEGGENLDLMVENTSGGALQFYVYMELEEFI
jgi:hypothetical protein